MLWKWKQALMDLHIFYWKFSYFWSISCIWCSCLPPNLSCLAKMEQIVLSEYIEGKVEKLAGKTSLIYSSTEVGSKVFIFKASALWADAFYKSKCPSVCPSVCLFVCLCVCSLLRYCLNVFLPPLPEVGCPIFLEIRNPLGKVMERSGLRYEHFCLKIV